MRIVKDHATVMNRAAEPPTHYARKAIVALLVSAMTIPTMRPVPVGLSAQETITVSGEVTCLECAITLDTVAILSGPDLQVSFVPGVAVDRRGRFLLTTARPEMMVFDSAGNFLRNVGRRGEGPGEYEWLVHINVGPRYIHAFDAERGRTLLDHDFRFVRADRFAANYLHSHMMDSETVVFPGDVLTEASAGYALHFLDLSGEMSSYDGDGVWRGHTGAVRHLVTGDSASLWVVEPRPNRMTRWDLEPEPGKAVVYSRVVEEFDRHGFDPDFWPVVSNVGALLDENGLWILWTTPDPRHAPTRGGELLALPPQEIRDSWLDLVDPSTGRTLARFHSDGSASDFVDGSRYFYFYNESDAGEPSVVIVEPHLVRGAQMRR